MFYSDHDASHAERLPKTNNIVKGEIVKNRVDKNMQSGWPNFGSSQNPVSRLYSNVMESFDIDVLIGKNLRRLREERHISQSALAQKINTSNSRISAIEHGREGMGKYLMTRICKALNVSPHVFYNGSVMGEKGTEDDQAQRVLALIREAQDLGIWDDLQEYAEYIIQKAIKEQKSREKQKTRKVG